ncbi:hypothetical protein GCM10022244_61710 [Streptomyces gulbargensis]|uniref:Uncharacterized protein n=2 Tax=Bacillati TaxID=1783272 RepID=A0ABP7NJK4_9ACTN
MYWLGYKILLRTNGDQIKSYNKRVYLFSDEILGNRVWLGFETDRKSVICQKNSVFIGFADRDSVKWLKSAENVLKTVE